MLRALGNGGGAVVSYGQPLLRALESARDDPRIGAAGKD